MWEDWFKIVDFLTLFQIKKSGEIIVFLHYTSDTMAPSVLVYSLKKN